MNKNHTGTISSTLLYSIAGLIGTDDKVFRVMRDKNGTLDLMSIHKNCLKHIEQKPLMPEGGIWLPKRKKVKTVSYGTHGFGFTQREDWDSEWDLSSAIKNIVVDISYMRPNEETYYWVTRSTNKGPLGTDEHFALNHISFSW